MSSEPLWKPEHSVVQSSFINNFCRVLEEKKYLKNDKDFFKLWQWTIKHPEVFWSEFWNFCNIKGTKGSKIIEKNKTFYKTKFFSDSKLNYAENLLSKKDDSLAINFLSETGQEDSINWNSLYEKVCKFSSALKKLGINKNDRIAAYVPNKIETIISFLACAKNGSIWSSASPDFGIQGVVDRFNQIEPKVLITCDYYFYNGKKIGILDKVEEILKKIPSIKQVIIFSYENSKPLKLKKDYLNFYELIAESELDETFERFEFNHPIYILYSSGTTGVPKCITHGAGNVLIEHNKEHLLHGNIKPNDKLFYYTTTGWMMWNWLVGALAVQASIYIYDGSPTFPKIDILIDYCNRKKITLFGVSAKYIDHLKNENFKADKYKLEDLKMITSTGSPLSDDSFKYVYQNIKKDVQLASIAGGTDMVGCLVLGNLFSNVYAGEIQGQSLGIHVDVFNEDGQSISHGEKGELVVRAPFPTMPIKFWNDDGDKKYQKAYFEKFDNVWHHSDYIEHTKHNGFIMHGRSDSTLKPGGVRIGTSEIYRQVENIDFVTEGLVVGQRWENDERIILFVTTKNNADLDEAKIQHIKKIIRERCSPKHVPAKIIKVPEIPRTKSGKIVELAVKNVINGIKVNNIEALSNPESLSFFENISQLAD
ncbi:MAG: acetoacetate--CoA ligase [Pelagibacteraceae bacterium]